MGTQEDFVIDPHYADWVWKHIRSSPRIYWPDDEKLIFSLELSTLETDRHYRDGTWDDENWKKWVQDMGVGGPRMVSHPWFKFQQDKVRTSYLAGVSYTEVGSWYTFEVQQDANEPVVFNPIRLPVTGDMTQEAREWAAGWGGEVTRKKPVEFKERYATALSGGDARDAAHDLSDVHVKIPGVETESAAKDVFTEATNMAERAVRQVK